MTLGGFYRPLLQDLRWVMLVQPWAAHVYRVMLRWASLLKERTRWRMPRGVLQPVWWLERELKLLGWMRKRVPIPVADIWNRSLKPLNLYRLWSYLANGLHIQGFRMASLHILAIIQPTIWSFHSKFANCPRESSFGPFESLVSAFR